MSRLCHICDFLGLTPEEDMKELASHPLDHHLIQLGRIHKPNLDYVVKFLKPFVYSVRRRKSLYFLSLCFNKLVFVNSIDNPRYPNNHNTNMNWW